LVSDPASGLQSRTDPSADAEAAAATLDPAQVIVTTTAGTVDRDTDAVTFDAAPGDIVRLYATSGSNNFENAVLLAKARSVPEGQTLDSFTLVEVTQSAIVPDPQSAEQTQEAEQDFWFCQTAIAAEGAASCRLLFAFYDRDDAGQPRFAAFYRFELQLTVQSSLPQGEEVQTQEQPS
jgi:hypothetical protein